MEITLFILALGIMLVGLAGVILPIIPGTPLILLAAFGFGLLTDFKYITGNTLITLTVLTGVSFVAEWLLTILGIKKMGGSWMGTAGSFVGMIAGLALPGIGLIGFIAGAFIGAVIGEMLAGKNQAQALRAGIGSFIGFLAGSLLKVVIASIMIGLFIWNVLFS